jgi:hypothetical protein
MPPYIAIYNEKPCEFMGTPNVETRAIMSQAAIAEGATTIPKGSTLKRVEAQGIRKDEDIVSSAWKHAAVHQRTGQGMANLLEDIDFWISRRLTQGLVLDKHHAICYPLLNI